MPVLIYKFQQPESGTEIHPPEKSAANVTLYMFIQCSSYGRSTLESHQMESIWDVLPIEILAKVLDSLPLREIVSNRRISHKWKKVQPDFLPKIAKFVVVFSGPAIETKVLRIRSDYFRIFTDKILIFKRN